MKIEKYTDTTESPNTYGECGSCHKPVGTFLGALFQLNGVYYHHDCFPTDFSFPCAYHSPQTGLVDSSTYVAAYVVTDNDGKKWLIIK